MTTSPGPHHKQRGVRRLTDAEILSDLQRIIDLWARLGEKTPLTQDGYKALGGRHDRKTFFSRWGDWRGAMDATQIQVHAVVTQRRACLRCEQGFMSEGPHNRLCQQCQVTNAHLAGGLRTYRLGGGAM